MKKEEQLCKLCRDLNFNKEEVLELMKDVNPNEVIEESGNTFLYEAFLNDNFKMIELLLENGADPNYFDEDNGPLLWELQYSDDSGLELDKQLALVKLLLDYGANPDIIWCGESLMEYIGYKVFNEVGDDNWEYILVFFVYLIAYGGKLHNGMPEIYQPIDRDKLNEYKFLFTEGGGRGIIVRDGDIVAYI